MVFRFILAVLATWRVTHLIAQEDGPWNSIARVRELAGSGFWGTLMDCFQCLSIWVAAPFAFFVSRKTDETVVIWLSLSGGAILIQELIPRKVTLEEEKPNDVLWEQEGEAASGPKR